MSLNRWPTCSVTVVLACLCLSPPMLIAQATPGTANASAKSSAMEREFQQAQAAQDRGDLDRAESLLKDLHHQHPGIFALDETLGLLLVQRNRFDEALPLLQSASQESSDSSAAHANLGAVYYNLHRNQEALVEFKRAVRLDPHSLLAYVSLGRIQMEQHHAREASEAFASALRIEPGNLDLMLDRTQALIEAGERASATVSLQSFTDGDHSAAVQLLWGKLEEKNGAFLQAGQHFTRAVELDPSETNVWALCAELLRHWNFDAAIQELEPAVVKFPQSAQLKLGLGAAYFGNANYAAAIPVFADLLTAEPGNATYAEMLGLSCKVLMQEAKPRCSVLLNYAQAHPGDARAATYAATFLIDGGSDDAQRMLARRLLQNALAADPKLADAQFELGLWLQNESQWKESVQPLETALALKPNYAQAHYRLALAYWRTGRKQDAQREMDLQKKFSAQQKEDLDQRLRQITRFMVEVHNPPQGQANGSVPTSDAK